MEYRNSFTRECDAYLYPSYRTSAAINDNLRTYLVIPMPYECNIAVIMLMGKKHGYIYLDDEHNIINITIDTLSPYRVYQKSIIGMLFRWYGMSIDDVIERKTLFMETNPITTKQRLTNIITPNGQQLYISCTVDSHDIMERVRVRSFNTMRAPIQHIGDIYKIEKYWEGHLFQDLIAATQTCNTLGELVELSKCASAS